MIKKKTVFALLMLALLPAVARQVEPAVARQVAENFMTANGAANVKSLVDITAETPFTAFYVFASPEGGFVLVSGDDRAVPILGYSTTQRFVTSKRLPDHVLSWLEAYEEGIRYCQSAFDEPGDEVAAMWQTLLSPEFGERSSELAGATSSSSLHTSHSPLPLPTAVAPLLSTTWDQDPYYNSLCPYDNGAGEYTVTGCVATATAQIMKYWGHPTTGYGSHSYVASNSHANYGVQSANFGNTTYNWSNMPNALTATSSASQVSEVATLMKHIGVAVEMEYDISDYGGSGASNMNGIGYIDYSAQTALVKNFKYRPEMTGAYREDYTSAEWNAMLMEELSHNRPILYSGRDASGGHSFVLDGYNNNGQFHVNWGWGGYYDGYYVIGALNPSGGGTGGNSSYTFNSGNSALMGIRPDSAWNSAGSTVVSATAAGGGAGCSVTGSGTYAFGDTITVCAIATGAYRFTGWSDGTKFNPRQFIATGSNISVTANFEQLHGDTMTYCPGYKYITSFGATGSTSYWGMRIPAEAINDTQMLTAVQFYATATGSHTLTVYKGVSSPTTALATVPFTVTSYGWQQIDISPVDAGGQSLWVTFSSAAQYPAAVSYSGGNEYGLLWGQSFSFANYSNVSFMIVALFNTDAHAANCDLVTSYPYTMGFEQTESAAMQCWSVVDADGDGYSWTTAVSSGKMASASFINDIGPLTPDNWLISPQMHFEAGRGYTLSWIVSPLDQNYYTEHYGVFVSTTGTDISDFSMVHQYTMTTANPQTITLDLSAFAGNDVYVAFRHWNVTDVYWMLLDDIAVTELATPPAQTFTVTVQSANPSWGTVAGGGTCDAGDETMIRAIPYDGYHFDHWNDGNTQNPRTVTVTADVTYTAYFAPNVGIAAGPAGQGAGFEIHPNPASTVATIEGAPDDAVVRVMDVSGRTVANLRGNTIDASRLARGTYFVRIATDGGSVVRKLIVK